MSVIECHNHVTFVGACTKLTCILTSGELVGQDISALHLSLSTKKAASCDLDIALGQ